MLWAVIHTCKSVKFVLWNFLVYDVKHVTEEMGKLPYDCINPPPTSPNSIGSLGSQMENQDKWNQINTCDVYFKKEPMSTNFLQ
jgi:hypothetical protein